MFTKYFGDVKFMLVLKTKPCLSFILFSPEVFEKKKKICLLKCVSGFYFNTRYIENKINLILVDE